MTEDFASTVRAMLVTAREHAARLKDITEPVHRRLCEHLAERVVAVFTEACRASEGFLQFHQKRDANGSAGQLAAVSAQAPRCVVPLP